ncbi:MAG: hypothetical protein R2734_04695 [Nocardioides sp.]
MLARRPSHGQALGTAAAASLLRAVHEQARGRLAATVVGVARRRCGIVSWVLLTDGWWAVRPLADGAPPARVELVPVRPAGLAAEIARLAAGSRRDRLAGGSAAPTRCGAALTEIAPPRTPGSARWPRPTTEPGTACGRRPSAGAGVLADGDLLARRCSPHTFATAEVAVGLATSGPDGILVQSVFWRPTTCWAGRRVGFPGMWSMVADAFRGRRLHPRPRWRAWRWARWP